MITFLRVYLGRGHKRSNTHRWGRLTVCLASSLTGFDSVVSEHKNDWNRFDQTRTYLPVWSNLFQLYWRPAVQSILPPVVSVLWSILLRFPAFPKQKPITTVLSPTIFIAFEVTRAPFYEENIKSKTTQLWF